MQGSPAPFLLFLDLDCGCSWFLETHRIAEAEQDTCWLGGAWLYFCRIHSKTDNIHFCPTAFQPLPAAQTPQQMGGMCVSSLGAGTRGRRAPGTVAAAAHHRLELGGRETGPKVPEGVEGGQDAEVKKLPGWTPGLSALPVCSPRRLSLSAGSTEPTWSPCAAVPCPCLQALLTLELAPARRRCRNHVWDHRFLRAGGSQPVCPPQTLKSLCAA